MLGGRCLAGHELTEDTLTVSDNRPRCRECQLGYQREHYARKKDGQSGVLISSAELAVLREKAWKYDELSH